MQKEAASTKKGKAETFAFKTNKGIVADDVKPSKKRKHPFFISHCKVIIPYLISTHTAAPKPQEADEDSSSSEFHFDEESDSQSDSVSRSVSTSDISSSATDEFKSNVRHLFQLLASHFSSPPRSSPPSVSAVVFPFLFDILSSSPFCRFIYSLLEAGD